MESAGPELQTKVSADVRHYCAHWLETLVILMCNFMSVFAFDHRAQDTQDEFEEYQESSRALEAELEAQLEQVEKQNADLRLSKVRLEQELEALKVCITMSRAGSWFHHRYRCPNHC